MQLAREGKQQAWWQTLDWPEPLSTYIGLEAEAVSIRTFESDVIPGLLQTKDYARALMRGAVPPLSQDDIEKHVDTRLRRQEILTRADPPKFHAVIDEAAFHRLPGGPAVMGAQLDSLMDLTRRPVTSRCSLTTTGPHQAFDSTFTILDYAAPVLSSTVYVDSLGRNLLGARSGPPSSAFLISCVLCPLGQRTLTELTLTRRGRTVVSGFLRDLLPDDIRCPAPAVASTQSTQRGYGDRKCLRRSECLWLVWRKARLAALHTTRAWKFAAMPDLS